MRLLRGAARIDWWLHHVSLVDDDRDLLPRHLTTTSSHPVKDHLSLPSEYATARAHLDGANEELRFEFIYSFSHSLIRQVEAILIASPVGDVPPTNADSISVACALGTRLLYDAPMLQDDCWEFADCATDAIGSNVLSSALRDARRAHKFYAHRRTPPDCFDFEKLDKSLARRAAFKCESVVALTTAALEELPQLAGFYDARSPRWTAQARTAARELCTRSLSELTAISEVDAGGEQYSAPPASRADRQGSRCSA